MIRKQQQIGNYIIERELGRGATSEVWLARHAHLDQRTVAIKVLLSQDQETIQRFSMEAGLLSQLQHPNIIRIYDHGYTEHFYYSILEYIEGSSLQQYLQQERRLSFADALHIFTHIAAALDHAHSQHIIHRDISPGNILLEEPTRRALLTDFGIARDPNNNVTLDHRIMGTPGYWSPEHTRSARDVTHLSDIYSLGVLLYAMLCGDLPWDDIPGTHAAFGKPLSVKERGLNNLPPDIDRIIQTMLAIDPDKRYPTAQAAVEDLERLYQRHHATTRMETRTTSGTPPAAQATDRTNQTIHVTGIQENDVETILGPDLIRAPIARAHQRARDLGHPDTIADMLNTWSHQGFRRGIFRRPLLGRLAHLHEITSYTLYFYHLQILYEQRNDPHTIEEPDNDAITPPLEPDTDRWHVPLPSIQDFTAHPGEQAILPGSTRVVACETCKGHGKTPCPRCKGKRRITITREIPPDPEERAPPPPPAARAAHPTRPTPRTPPNRARSTSPESAPAPRPQKPRTEQVVIPCPDCEGVGGTPCPRCNETGRLIQRKAFRWQRYSKTLQEHDTITGPNQEWLLKTCQPVEVYRERITGKPHDKQPALAPEWETLPTLQPLIKEALGNTGPTTRIILSELSISMIPITHITFDLGTRNKQDEPVLYHLDICGFENATPNEWSLLNWERVIFFWLNAFMLILVIIFGYFAFTV